jgi:hypothetical protein
MEQVIGFVSSKLFIGNLVLCVVLLELGMRPLKKMYPKNAADRERDIKYAPFVRMDLKKINRLKMIPFIPFFLLKWGLTIVAWAILAMMTKLLYIG